jgi:hypothetical protein
MKDKQGGPEKAEANDRRVLRGISVTLLEQCSNNSNMYVSTGDRENVYVLHVRTTCE